MHKGCVATCSRGPVLVAGVWQGACCAFVELLLDDVAATATSTAPRTAAATPPAAPIPAARTTFIPASQARTLTRQRSFSTGLHRLRTLKSRHTPLSPASTSTRSSGSSGLSSTVTAVTSATALNLTPSRGGASDGVAPTRAVVADVAQRGLKDWIDRPTRVRHLGGTHTHTG